MHFRGVQDTSLPEARSRRRDDGSGQAANMTDCGDQAHVRLGNLSSQTPSSGGSRRPRTEARPRRKDIHR
jgi:hypothetical protein